MSEKEKKFMSITKRWQKLCQSQNEDKIMPVTKSGKIRMIKGEQIHVTRRGQSLADYSVGLSSLTLVLEQASRLYSYYSSIYLTCYLPLVTEFGNYHYLYTLLATITICYLSHFLPLFIQNFEVLSFLFYFISWLKLYKFNVTS